MSATEKLEEAAREQEQLGAGGPLDSTVKCPVCNESAHRVSAHTTPRSGPLVLEGYYAHVDDGDAYYHEGDDSDAHEEGPAEELADRVRAAGVVY